VTEQRATRAEKQENKGRMGIWLPPKERIAKAFFLLSSFKKICTPGSGKHADAEDDKVQIVKHKKLSMTSTAKERNQ